MATLEDLSSALDYRVGTEKLEMCLRTQKQRKAEKGFELN